MKHLNKIILSSLVLVLFLGSCIKEDINEGITNTEQTIVKIIHGEDEFYAYFFDPAEGEVTLDVLDVRRDAKDQADLNKTNVVKILADQTALADFNAANGTNFEFFTDYEEVAGSIPFDGSNWTATFDPGDFAKLYTIKFNTANLDFTKQYAMAFTIADGGGATISTDKAHLIVQISVKNKYDGIYELTGTMADAANPNLGPWSPQEVAFVTTGTSSVVMIPTELGIPGHLIHDNSTSPPGDSYYGSFGPTFVFDPATDKVSSVINSYGQPAGNTRSCELDPSGLNQWDAGTKELNVKYFMIQPSFIPAPPHIRVKFDEKFTFKGPR